MFSYESRTNPLPFKPYDNNFGFSEPFSCHFLLCSAGGSLSQRLELKEVSLGLFPLAFLLFPGATCDFFICNSYYVVLLVIRIFICYNTLWYNIVSQSLFPTSNLHFLRYSEGSLFFKKLTKLGNDIERIFSLLPPLFSPPCPLAFPLLPLLNLSYVAKDAVPIDANG